MRRAALLSLAILAACQADRLGPHPTISRDVSIVAANDDGPPSSFPGGSDTYRIGVFTGAGRHKIDCVTANDGGCEGNGDFRRDVDKTLLAVRLRVPPGTGPVPLVPPIHWHARSTHNS